MESFGKLIDAHNRAGADFLFVELETAHTFLQTAATSQVEEGRVRNRKNAHVAYETILKHAPDVTLMGEQKQRFEALLAELRTRLLDAGIAL